MKSGCGLRIITKHLNKSGLSRTELGPQSMDTIRSGHQGSLQFSRPVAHHWQPDTLWRSRRLAGVLTIGSTQKRNRIVQLEGSCQNHPPHSLPEIAAAVHRPMLVKPDSLVCGISHHLSRPCQWLESRQGEPLEPFRIILIPCAISLGDGCGDLDDVEDQATLLMRIRSVLPDFVNDFFDGQGSTRRYLTWFDAAFFRVIHLGRDGLKMPLCYFPY